MSGKGGCVCAVLCCYVYIDRPYTSLLAVGVVSIRRKHTEAAPTITLHQSDSFTKARDTFIDDRFTFLQFVRYIELNLSLARYKG